jgi:hypothetical protein
MWPQKSSQLGAQAVSRAAHGRFDLFATPISRNDVVAHLGNRKVSTNRAPQAGAPSGRTAQYFAIAAMLIGWLPILTGPAAQQHPAAARPRRRD